MNTALIIIVALLLNIIFGGSRRLYEAIGIAELMGFPAKFLRDMERKLNREHRSKEERQRRGVILVAVVIFFSLFAGWLLQVMLGHSILVPVVLAFCMPLRSLWDRVAAIYKHVKAGAVVPARDALEGTVFRHYALLDMHGVVRAGIELLAVQFSEKIMAVVFWYILLGLPGVLMSKAVYLLRETVVGALSTPSEFGKAASDVHRVLHYIPSRGAALMWLLVGAFLPQIQWQQVMKCITKKIITEAPHGLALTCASSVLFLSLGGPSSAYVNDRWIGSGTSRAGADDMKRARFLFSLLGALLFIGCSPFL